MNEFHFVKVEGRPHLKMGARVESDGQLDVRMFDADSDDWRVADEVCNIEAVCGEAMIAAIRKALDAAVAEAPASGSRVS